MTAKWNSLKRELFANYPICQLCEVQQAVHLHHCIVSKGQVRNRMMHKYLDVIENALEVCQDCHVGADAYNTRLLAWNIQCRRYGRERINEWYDNLPFKVKENF